MAKGEVEPPDIGLGRLILNAVEDTTTAVGERNTIMGTILLYVPLVAGFGYHLSLNDGFNQTQFRSNIDRILSGTTVKDSVNLYRAFNLCRPSGGLIRSEAVWTEAHDRYDIENADAIRNIEEDEITLLELFRMSAPVDEISNEWATSFDLVLNHVWPFLNDVSSGLEDIEEGVVRTYIWLLARRPDGLIVKKAGSARAEEVRKLAAGVLTSWKEDRGAIELLRQLDEALRREGNLLNPGTTADLVSAAVLCNLASTMC